MAEEKARQRSKRKLENPEKCAVEAVDLSHKMALERLIVRSTVPELRQLQHIS
jgi:hypothetical protein